MRPENNYSGLIPFSCASFFQRSVSVTITWRNCSGVLPTGAPPSASNTAATSGDLADLENA